MGAGSSTYLKPQFDVRERVREAENTGVLCLAGAGAPNFTADLLRKVTALEALDMSNNPLKTLPDEVRPGSPRVGRPVGRGVYVTMSGALKRLQRPTGALFRFLVLFTQ